MEALSTAGDVGKSVGKRGDIMMWLMDQPFLIAGFGLFFVIVFVSGLIKTGNRSLLYVIIAIILIVAGLITAERMIKTDREQVREALYDVADAVEKNDEARVLSHIHSQAETVRHAVQNHFQSFDFTYARITKLHKIIVDSKRSPPSVKAEFNVRVNVERFRQPYLGFLIVTFHKENDRWKVRDYERHDDFLKGFKKRD